MDTQNTPFSVKLPANWEAVAAYSRGGKRPSTDIAQKVFDELLKNIRVENCVFHPEVVNAMLRVAPARIEAENFGHEGLGKSYQVKELKRSTHYRQSEHVPITVQSGGRRQSSQYVTLKAAEWTVYTITSQKTCEFEISVRAKSSGPATEIGLTTGDKTQVATIPQSDWREIKLGTFAFAQGQNRLKLEVKGGVADIDWLDVRLSKEQKQSASAEASQGQ